MKKQAITLSVALSLASLGSNLATCTAQPQSAAPLADEPAGFCYHTLGEISCFTAPQPHLGPIVALPPEPPKTEPPKIEAATAAPANSSTKSETANPKPIALKPDA